MTNLSKLLLKQLRNYIESEEIQYFLTTAPPTTTLPPTTTVADDSENEKTGELPASPTGPKPKGRNAFVSSYSNGVPNSIRPHAAIKYPVSHPLPALISGQ